MKTNAIVRIVCYSLVALVLTGVLLMGLGSGGFSLSFHNSGEPINGEIRVDATKIQNIEIEWVSGNVSLSMATDGSQDIQVREVGATQKNPAVWEISGQTLVIRYQQQSMSFGITSTQDKDLIITLPAGWLGNELDIETVSGSVQVDGLSATEIDVECVSAQCSFTGCTAKTVTLSTVSGDVKYCGEVEKLDCESVSADCQILPENAPRELQLESVSGDLIVGLRKDVGFTTNLDSLSGNIYSDFSTSSIGGDQTYGNGSCQINAETVSGDIRIKRV